MARIENPENWDKIQKNVLEAERLLGQSKYNLSMIKLRQTLEYMVKLQCDRAGIVEGAPETMIRELYRGEWMSKPTAERYLRILAIGNSAEENGDNSEENARQALKLMNAEVSALTGAQTTGTARTSSAARNAAERQAAVRTRQAEREARAGSQNARVISGTGAEEKQTLQTAASSRTRAGSSRELNVDGGAIRSGRSSYAGSSQTRSGRSSYAGSSTTRSGRSSYADDSTARSGRSSSADGSVTRNRRSSGSADGAYQNRRDSGSARTARSSRNTGSRSRRRARTGFQLPALLKLLIPVALILVLIFLIRILAPDQTPTTETTPAPETTEAPATMTPETTAETEPETTAAPVTYKTTDVLNVRKEPSTDAEKLGKLAKDTVVEYVGDENDSWAVIMYNGEQAYVSKEYLTEAE